VAPAHMSNVAYRANQKANVCVREKIIFSQTKNFIAFNTKREQVYLSLYHV
jgi:hypothetical protein